MARDPFYTAGRHYGDAFGCCGKLGRFGDASGGLKSPNVDGGSKSPVTSGSPTTTSSTQSTGSAFQNMLGTALGTAASGVLGKWLSKPTDAGLPQPTPTTTATGTRMSKFTPLNLQHFQSAPSSGTSWVGPVIGLSAAGIAAAAVIAAIVERKKIRHALGG